MPKPDVIGRNGPRPKMKRGRNRNTVRNIASKKTSSIKMPKRTQGASRIGGLEKISKQMDTAAASEFPKLSGEGKVPSRSHTPAQGGAVPPPATSQSTITPPDNRMQVLAMIAQSMPATSKRMAARGEDLGGIPPRLHRTVARAAQKTGLSTDLLKAVGSVESGWNLKAVSSAGAKGPLQTMPFWSDEASDPYGKFDPTKRPRKAIRLGASILDDYIEQFGLKKGLAAYNAGPTGMSKGIGFDYARKVLELLRGS